MSCKNLWCWSVVVAAVVAPPLRTISAQQTAATDVDHYVWDLSPLYASEAAWETERNLILAKLGAVGGWKGKVGRDARSLAEAMDDVADLRRRAAKMAVYGILVSMEDIHSEKAQSQHSLGISLETQVEGAVSFVECERSHVLKCIVVVSTRSCMMLLTDCLRRPRVCSTTWVAGHKSRGTLIGP